MKVSEMTVQDIADYIKLDDATDKLLQPILSTAIKYVSEYTGIPQKNTEITEKTLDDYEDFYIAVLVLSQDMYDNRSMYVDNSNLNRVVDNILGMHRTNLLPTSEVVA